MRERFHKDKIGFQSDEKMKVYFLRVVAIILLNNKIVEGEDWCVRKLNRLGPMLRNSFSYHIYEYENFAFKFPF